MLFWLDEEAGITQPVGLLHDLYQCKLLIPKVVRKERFELSRSCERQPLKLVRLPVPPLSR